MGRAVFIERMAQYSPEELGFLDEVSKDERSIGRHYGRARKGERAKKKQPFVRGRRTSTEAFLTLDGIVAGTTSTVLQVFLMRCIRICDSQPSPLLFSRHAVLCSA
jgi:hypothetical protein